MARILNYIEDDSMHRAFEGDTVVVEFKDERVLKVKIVGIKSDSIDLMLNSDRSKITNYNINDIKCIFK